MPLTGSEEREDLLGKWDQWFVKKEGVIAPHVMGDPLTAKIAAEFLADDDIVEIEDWGSGHGGFRKYTAAHQTCINVDGSNSPHTDKVVDLRDYRTQVQAVHLRHILAHNHH